ncbi:ABC transporter ATP-binding protein [Actinomadura sp. KC06]|uniref:ABC transporter ATP-binding protein n=1 Tax=Actinomadura sp. KC06 TaxID=2530369 RepID=UPI0010480A1D|nr:ABC transporter ATP-binding protein [Actinomadura sp. KC06]TDD35640.1 ABC transporter ATP-binding protein [Actinomadura sp. KC06]
MDEALLDVDGLSVVHDGGTRIVQDVSFRLGRGEILGLVGESGSGKSLTALSLIGLLPPGLTRTGTVRLGGEDLTGRSEKQLERVRGSRIGMVFQDPMTGLNPVRRIGSVLVETILRHQDVSRAAAREKAVEALAAVGVPSPGDRVRAYPHQLSGGLRQRAMIALALINEPSVILADEPTTALDTTIQAQITQLMRDQIQARGASMILITHDLGVATELCDRVAVMYAGGVVEEGPTRELLRRPRHPYTAALLAAAPNFDRTRTLAAISGAPPSPFARPDGCPFHPRCERAQDACRTEEPVLTVSGSHRLACWNPHD